MRKARKMLSKMSETQRSLLQAAAAREDGILQPPGNARGAVTKSLAAKLIDAGWVKEIKAPNSAPVWRRDAASGGAFALKLTAKCFNAAGAAPGEGSDGSGNPSLTAAQEQTLPGAPSRKSTPSVRAPGATSESKASDIASPTSLRAPRPGTKLGAVVDRLSAEKGATISELTTATGWLDHTTRAALTGLRRRGYTLSLTPRERDGASVYRIPVIGGGAAK
jgi:hypothetical protein